LRAQSLSLPHKRRPCCGLPIYVIHLLTIVVSAACAADRSTLAGEWRIHLEVEGSASGQAAQFTDGVVVFSPRLPEYPAPTEGQRRTVVVGRGYIDFDRLFSRNSKAPSYYGQGLGADISEEILVTTQRGQSVRFVLAPQVFGTTTWFEGTLNNGKLTGRWEMLGHGETIREGSFTMSRVRSTSFTDSALARAKRAVAGLPADSLPAQGTSDTLPPMSSNGSAPAATPAIESVVGGRRSASSGSQDPQAGQD
jgi:hypothetical protein